MTLPSISVCIATYNSGKTLNECLKLIRSQDYPQGKIEIILGDGGSIDETLKIAKKYNAKVIKIPPKKQHAEYNRGVAFNMAKGEFALILDHDNFLPSKNWLTEMVEPLQDNPKMVAATTQYYHYSKKDKILDRYFALFGTSEPLPYFLKKADRSKQTDRDLRFAGEIVDRGKYYIVHFLRKPETFPSIGSNGTLMRRRLVLDNAQADPDHHYPIDVLVDVLLKGHSEFGIVKNSIIHLTHSRGFIEFMKRRKRFVEQYHFEEKRKRRWSVVMPSDKPKVFLYILYSLTVVLPTIEAINGYRKIPDIAWFFHPLMCFATTLIYGYVTIKFALKRWM